jgi:glycosyltransferase involved in cell wall biosynthesis
MPKLSYLVSTYDSAGYLDLHLENLLNNQTDPDFEIVVVNPNSPGVDGHIAEKWRSVDNRIKYIYHPQRETYGSSWLRAWQYAKGEFVVNSNTDDLHQRSFTADFYDTMSKANSQVAFCYSGLTVSNVTGQIIGGGIKPPFDFDLMSRECWAGPQVCWRNDGEFVNSLDWGLMHRRAEEYKSAFDYWLWLYFMSEGYIGTVIPKQLTIYTQRSDSLENTNKWENNWETYSSISEFFPHHFKNHLKHAKEFINFENRPSRDEWVQAMMEGKKWK